jgi:hypothetical protein
MGPCSSSRVNHIFSLPTVAWNYKREQNDKGFAHLEPGVSFLRVSRPVRKYKIDNTKIMSIEWT